MKKLSILLAAGTAGAATVTAIPARAADAPAAQADAQIDSAQEAGSALDEIVVIGRKRARSEALQQTPVSITALTALQLDRAVSKDLTDVGRMTPNASLQPSAQRGVQNFAIRGMGVSGSTPSDEPAVGIFQDGVYWGSNYGALNELFDIESVEILRGPQGTLFGRNVTGGAVTVRSARPAQETSAKMMLGIGNGMMLEGSAVANLPIVADTLATRVAVLTRRNQGLFKDEVRDRSYGRTSSFVVRPSLRWTPSPAVDLTLLGEFYQQQGDPVVVRGVAPNTVRGGPLTLAEKEGYTTPADFFTVSPGDSGSSNVKVYFTMLEADIDIGPGVLTSVTGYRKVRSRVLTDFDGTPSDGFLQGVRNDQHQWSSELRYAADIADWLSMTAGLYYFDQSFSFAETRDLNNHASLLATRSMLDNSSFAAFTEVDIKPLQNLTVTLGGRYTEEKKVASSAPFGRCTFDLVTCTFTGPARYKGDNFSPKVGIAYQIEQGPLLFASMTKGYRSGGFALRGTALASPYDPEKVTAYEAGFKSDWLDRHLRLNISAYYNKYKDLQRTVLAPDPVLGVIQSVFNAADAEIKGAEFELSAIPVDGLTLAATYGYTRARYKTFLGVSDPGSRRFVRVPEHTANLAADYETDLGNGDGVGFHLGAAYSGTYFFDDANLLSQKGYWLVDVNVFYRLQDRMTVSAYGRNLANQKYASWGSSLGALGQNMFPGDPRTYGLRITAEF
ncbi:TonB-dependent receptor [Novosphingobium sp. BL-52-GroH]|uniref:TonB-dependent receptor n=1 Tax=Novosphingobium sp. BL-52-GroH TaxID=3349877 RepID=UPI00384FD14D